MSSSSIAYFKWTQLSLNPFNFLFWYCCGSKTIPLKFFYGKKCTSIPKIEKYRFFSIFFFLKYWRYIYTTYIFLYYILNIKRKDIIKLKHTCGIFFKIGTGWIMGETSDLEAAIGSTGADIFSGPISLILTVYQFCGLLISIGVSSGQ